ncbi:sigma-54-dependent Fis family transcriptional regulator [Pseudonocardia alni]|uniref:sigma-54-dependent Fis family transcriptional regulator n=1 Tax=Pseudonocardia alni TaxID=33907 RepID=UPI00280A9468|nr:helix-turn-helix domain-containing protein [Pseudonocardia alni]
MSGRSDPAAGFPELVVASWQRVSAAGLAHDSDPRVAPAGTPSRGRLCSAATAVLDRFESDIADSPFGVALADRSCRIVDVRFGRRSIRRRVADSLGLLPGARFDEESTGTNALSVPFETRREVRIAGDQHYLESMRGFTCWGMPILHPVTARLEGVVDIMVDSGHASALMLPMLRRLVDDIRTELAARAAGGMQRGLEEFLARSARTDAPMVLLRGDFVLGNRAARDQLDAADYAALQESADAVGPGPRREVALGQGTSAIEVVRVDGGGVLCVLGTDPVARVIPRGANASRCAGERLAESVRRLGRLPACGVAVLGEAGTGRSRLAREIAPDADHHDCTGDRSADRAGLDRVLGATAGRPVVVDDVHLLDDSVALRLVRALAAGGRRFVLTAVSGPTDAGREVPAPVACCTERLVVPPVRERLDELGSLTTRLLGELGAGGSRVSPPALRALGAHRWPGNLHELRGVLAVASRAVGGGDIGPRDLPTELTARRRRAGLTALQAVEADAIERALLGTGGNKAHAAKRLGLSRTTLYARLRSYGIRA